MLSVACFAVPGDLNHMPNPIAVFDAVFVLQLA